MKHSDHRRKILRKIFALCIVLIAATPAFAQHPTDEDFAINLMRLRDDSDGSRIFIVKNDGTYFTNASPFRIESFGNIQKKGCAVTLTETTPFYRLVMAGDSCRGVGKVSIQLFGIANFSLLDRTSN